MSRIFKRDEYVDERCFQNATKYRSSFPSCLEEERNSLCTLPFPSGWKFSLSLALAAFKCQVTRFGSLGERASSSSDTLSFPVSTILVHSSRFKLNLEAIWKLCSPYHEAPELFSDGLSPVFFLSLSILLM